MEILHTPGSYYSVHDDLIFTVVDTVKANDPVTYPDYRYICDVYNNDSLVARLKAYPRPDNKIGVFDVGNILRNYITPVFEPTTGQILSQSMGLGEFNVSGTCIFGEEYDFVQYLNVSGDTGRIYYGHYNGRKIGVNTILAARYGTTATARPTTSKVYEDAAIDLFPFFANASGVTVDVILYDSSGNNIGSASDTVVTTSGEMVMFNVAPPGIGDIITVPDNCAYYTVEFDGALYRFDLFCEARYEVFTVYFLNRYGGFETFHLNKVSRKSVAIERSEFGKPPYEINDDGEPEYYNANNVYKEQRSVFAVQYKEQMTLNTDALTDAEYQWLADLVLSPMIFLEEDGYYFPVTIAETNYEFRKRINDKVTNLVVTLAFGDRLNAQYR